MNWIKLAQDRNRMQGVFKLLIKRCLPLNSGDFLVVFELLHGQKVV